MVMAFPSQLAELFADARVLPPQIPPALLDRLVPVQRSRYWATDPELPNPYNPDHYWKVLRHDSPPLAVMGISGHGVNSWALHIHVVDGRLAAFVQSGWGGAYMDHADSRYLLALRLARLERVRGAVAVAADAGRVAPDERLLYADLGFSGSWACWIDPDHPAPTSRPSENVAVFWKADGEGFQRLVDHLASRSPGQPPAK